MSRKSNILSVALVILCLSLCCLGLNASLLYAGENYGSHYAGGQEDLFMGFMGPPGSSVLENYTMYYQAKKLKDNAGRNVKVNAGPFGFVPLDFKNQMIVNALRYKWTTNLKLLGGNVGFQVVIPAGYEHTAMNAPFPVGDIASTSKTGLGDMELGAAIGWHPTKTFHNLAIVEVIAPTGNYSESDDANALSRNYWTFYPGYIFTYVGDMDSPIPGFEVGAKLAYQFNTINTDTSYTTGQEFVADYVVAQHLGKTWAVGANGTFLYQTTKDKQHGRTAVDPFSGRRTGVKSQYFSVGPMLAYYLPCTKGASITAKYQFDMWEKNRPHGEKLWVHISWPFL